MQTATHMHSGFNHEFASSNNSRRGVPCITLTKVSITLNGTFKRSSSVHLCWTVAIPSLTQLSHNTAPSIGPVNVVQPLLQMTFAVSWVPIHPPPRQPRYRIVGHKVISCTNQESYFEIIICFSAVFKGEDQKGEFNVRFNVNKSSSWTLQTWNNKASFLWSVLFYGSISFYASFYVYNMM